MKYLFLETFGFVSRWSRFLLFRGPKIPPIFESKQPRSCYVFADLFASHSINLSCPLRCVLATKTNNKTRTFFDNCDFLLRCSIFLRAICISNSDLQQKTNQSKRHMIASICVKLLFASWSCNFIARDKNRWIAEHILFWLFAKNCFRLALRHFIRWTLNNKKLSVLVGLLLMFTYSRAPTCFRHSQSQIGFFLSK